MFNSSQSVNPSKVACYIRWSTDEQGNGTTKEVQLESCRKYLDYKGWTLREELVFIDDGYSGGNLERPAMTKLRQAVQDGEVECVVVYKLDRLSRNLFDTVNLVRGEWADQCALFSTQEDFNTNNPVGQMIFNILVSFAEFERNVIRDRTQSGKKKRAEAGRNAGQMYVYGLKRGETAGAWALDGWDESAGCFVGPAAIVRRVFTEYLTGRGTYVICDNLNQESVPSPAGGLWRNSQVLKMLENPIYMGTYAYGRYKKVGKSYKKGQPVFQVEGAAPAIVTKEEFERVQELRKERSTYHKRTLSYKNEYLLVGLMRCAKCGGPMVGSNSQKVRYYRCDHGRNYKTCDCGMIHAEQLEQAFVKDLRQVLTTGSLNAFVSNIEARMLEEVSVREHAVNTLRSELDALKKRRKKLEDDYFNAEISGKTYERMTTQLDEQIEQAKERLLAAGETLGDARNTKVNLDHLQHVAARWEAWQELSAEEVRQLIREVVAEVSVYRKKTDNGHKTNPVELAWQPRLDLTIISKDANTDVS